MIHRYNSAALYHLHVPIGWGGCIGYVFYKLACHLDEDVREDPGELHMGCRRD